MRTDKRLRDPLAESLLHELRTELEKGLSIRQMRPMVPSFERGGGQIDILGRRLLDFTNWDILGINQHPTPKRASHRVLEDLGLASGSSRLCSGTTRHHLSCEQRVASFLGTECALLFSSRNQAVLSLVTNLFHERDVLFVDEGVQSPVVDAAYLVHAEVATFRARDAASLEEELGKVKTVGVRKGVFVESVNPYTGVRAPLNEIAAVCRRFGALLFVDESYGLGMLGVRGAGGAEFFGAHHHVLCLYGGMEYGLGAYGGFIAAPSALGTWLLHRSKTFSGEAPVPAPIAAFIEEAVNVVEGSPVLRRRACEHGERIRRGLRNMGYEVSGSEDLALVTVQLPTLRIARGLEERLVQKGCLVESVGATKVRSEGAFVRILAHALHHDTEIEALLGACAELIRAVQEEIAR
jgi:glycine C-acetyltransferase